MTDFNIALQRKGEHLQRRRQRVHKKLHGIAERLRLVVYRSNNHIYAQIVDDVQQRTITGCSSLTPGLREKIASSDGKTAKAKVVGEYIAGLAKEKGITKVAFDRNGRRYHGRVRALAEGARAGGLEF